MASITKRGKRWLVKIRRKGGIKTRYHPFKFGPDFPALQARSAGMGNGIASQPG